MDTDVYEDQPGIDSDLDDPSSESDEDETPTGNPRKWTRETNTMKFTAPDAQFEDPKYTFNDHRNIHADSTPFEILKTFIDSRMIQKILEQTNLRAEQLRSNTRTLLKWTELKENELWVFLGLHLLTGIVRKPRLRDYWSRRELIETPIFAKHMSRNRFEDILRCIHFSDNENPPPNSDRLWKLGDFLPCLFANFEACISPGEFLCVDESLMAYKGRLSFKQYNPLKRSRFGVKYFALVDCETKFLVKINVYLGKGTNVDPRMKEMCGLGGASVVQLLQQCFWKNHKLVVDNCFNSPNLQEHLASKNTFCLGTVRADHKGMPKLTKSKSPKGSVEPYFSKGLLYEKWSDRRQVNMLNSFVPHQMTFVSSPNPGNSREKPDSVIIYNKMMGGVDHVDQILSPYTADRKTIRWYKKLSTCLILQFTIHSSCTNTCFQRGK